MKVRCSRASCLYEWDYNGKAKWYASCPRCHSSVNLRLFFNPKLDRELLGEL